MSMMDNLEIPRSSAFLTDVQVKIFELRSQKMPLREISIEIDKPLEEKLNLCPNSIRTAIKWTVLGHTWKPHTKGGTHKLLNPDDSCNLLSWAEEKRGCSAR